MLPKTYIYAVAGLAILGSLQDALEKSFAGELRFGALTGFVVAATPFSVLGVSSPFWAIVAGVVASAVVERRQLLKAWSNPVFGRS